jgi:hypothetical protein
VTFSPTVDLLSLIWRNPGRSLPGQRARSWRKHKTRAITPAVVEVAIADRASAVVERIGCRAADDPSRLTWAAVWHPAYRTRLTREPPTAIGRDVTLIYTHRTVVGALREARPVSCALNASNTANRRDAASRVSFRTPNLTSIQVVTMNDSDRELLRCALHPPSMLDSGKTRRENGWFDRMGFLSGSSGATTADAALSAIFLTGCGERHSAKALQTLARKQKDVLAVTDGLRAGEEPVLLVGSADANEKRLHMGQLHEDHRAWRGRRGDGWRS